MDVNATVDIHVAMERVFGQLNWQPIADGKIHRFHIAEDRLGTQNGWYIIFPGENFGKFGSWRTGRTYNWSNSNLSSNLGNLQFRERREKLSHNLLAKQHSTHAAAAKRAHHLWQNSKRPDPHHPYLSAKGCNPHNLRQFGNTLLVPIFHGGHLVNLQRISPSGEKRFLPGGRINQCYSLIGTPSPLVELYICEGWATGATIHEETGAVVACAMNSGNLLRVGQHLHSLYPDATLIIAGDDDRKTAGNPGREAAIKAAAALDCGYVFPLWPIDAPSNLSDFNDLRQWLR